MTYDTDMGRLRLPLRFVVSPTKSSSSLQASSPLALWPPLSSAGLPWSLLSSCVLTLTAEAGGDTPCATPIESWPGEEAIVAGPGAMIGDPEEGVRLIIIGWSAAPMVSVLSPG